MTFLKGVCMDTMSILSSIFFLIVIFLFYQEAALVIGIVLGVFLFLYNFLWDIPKSLMEFILENGLSEHVDYFYDARIPIVSISLLLIVIWSIPVGMTEKFGTKTAKIIAVIFGVVPFVGLLTYIHSDTQEGYFKNVFNSKYEDLSSANMYFNNSKVGKELRNAIDTKNYTVINKYYPKNSSLEDYVNKKVNALSVEEYINKKALITSINVPIITEKFKSIANDNYITLEEYEQFKKEVLEIANFNPLKLNSEQLRFIYSI
jgi:hypothetical protein